VNEEAKRGITWSRNRERNNRWLGISKKRIRK